MKLSPYDKLPGYPRDFDSLLMDYVLGSDKTRIKAIAALREQGLWEVARDVEDRIWTLVRRLGWLIMNSGSDIGILDQMNELLGNLIELVKEARANQSKCENNDQA